MAQVYRKSFMKVGPATSRPLPLANVKHRGRLPKQPPSSMSDIERGLLRKEARRHGQ